MRDKERERENKKKRELEREREIGRASSGEFFCSRKKMRKCTK